MTHNLAPLFMSMKSSIPGLSEPPQKAEFLDISWYFYTYERLKFHAQLRWAWIKFYNLGAIREVDISRAQG